MPLPVQNGVEKKKLRYSLPGFNDPWRRHPEVFSNRRIPTYTYTVNYVRKFAIAGNRGDQDGFSSSRGSARHDRSSGVHAPKRGNEKSIYRYACTLTFVYTRARAFWGACYFTTCVPMNGVCVAHAYDKLFRIPVIVTGIR